jgi:uncharacterized protein (DUF1697 family)
MPDYVAFLRAVNVGGHGNVSMARLKEFVAQLGFENPRTLLNSGNVLFSSDQRSAGDIEAVLEREADVRLTLKTDFLVRSKDELAEVIAANPFPSMAERDPSHLLVMFLKAAPDAKAVDALQAAITGPELVRPGVRCLYISYPAAIGTSKLTNAVIEGKLGTRGTGRNWNTVVKLAKQ